MGYKKVKYQRFYDDQIIISAEQDKILVRERKSPLYINKSYPVMSEYGGQTTDIMRPSSVFIPRRQPTIFDDTPFELKYTKLLQEIAASKASVRCAEKGCKERKINAYPRSLNPFEEDYHYQKNIIPDIKNVTNEDPVKDDNMADLVKTETNKNSEDIKTREKRKPKSKLSKNLLNRFTRRITKSFRSLFKSS